MSELDLLNLARSTTQNQVAWFAQVVTINFAMVVAVYYLLNKTKIALKLFAFVAYSVGMLVLSNATCPRSAATSTRLAAP